MLKQTRIAALALLLCVATAGPGLAQEEMPSEDLPIGVIPGTEMTHDEFRARAEAQLAAVALNALTYRVLNGEYAAGLYELYNSSAWNLDVMNMFTGQPVNAVMFTPGPDDMTSSAEVGLPFNVELGSAPAPAPTPAPIGDGEEGEGDSGQIEGITMLAAEPVHFRVDPTRITTANPGDIFYYADGEILQLLMYSGDGVYAEYFEIAPNGRWAAKVGLREAGQYWQQDVLAAQVLFFTGELLPQHYNHVQFMAEQPLATYTAPQRVDPWSALEMAADLDIVILNPSSKQPIVVSEGSSRGDFIDLSAGGSQLLTIGLQNGRASTLSQLYEAYAEPAGMQDRPAPKPKPSPLGGRR
jgi:hypothetical protein